VARLLVAHELGLGALGQQFGEGDVLRVRHPLVRAFEPHLRREVGGARSPHRIPLACKREARALCEAGAELLRLVNRHRPVEHIRSLSNIAAVLGELGLGVGRRDQEE